MNAKLAADTVVKTPAETKKVNFIFDNELGSGETISSVISCVVYPSGELTANGVESDTIVQVSLVGGLSETAFVIAAAGATFTATAHLLSNDHPVHVIADDANDVPTGLDVDEQYYIVNAAANSFQLALTPDGDAVTTTGAGQGTVGVDYRITAKISTSNNQVIVGEGICQVRS